MAYSILKNVRIPLCNGKPERAPHICGKCFILCWRCSMVTLFAVTVTVLLECFGKREIMNKPFVIISLMLIVPMIVDGIAQYFFQRESTNFRRGITGSLFGCGIAILTFQFWQLLQ